ncbi:MAG: hypothetical protein JST50_06960 [Bacteroidetes bacterium]|jgi:hypothetical protein|nr:hypothetical protein [Bacteroidota bacterium]
MVRRKLNVFSKVEASTVLEVVVSMVIIIAVFGIAMMIYANVSRMSLSGQKIKAQAVLSQVAKGISETDLGSNQQLMLHDLTIEKSVKPYADNNKILEVNLKAFDKNHLLLAESHELIISNEDK